MMAGKKITLSVLPYQHSQVTLFPSHCYLSLWRRLFSGRQSGNQECMLASCQGSSLKGCGRENGICVMKSTVDLKWYRQVTTAACSQIRSGNRLSGMI